MNKVFLFISCILLCAAAALAGTLATIPQIPVWYAGLVKPGFNPPNWAFGPAWTLLYIMMAIALYLFILKPGKLSKAGGYIFFFSQLIMNAGWSVVFFGRHEIYQAFLLIIVLWFFILLTILFFYRINPVSAYLLIPYICWVTFAAFLNFYIWQLN